MRNRTNGIRSLIIPSKNYCTVNLLKDDKLRDKNPARDKIELFIKLLGKHLKTSPSNLNRCISIQNEFNLQLSQNYLIVLMLAV